MRIAILEICPAREAQRQNFDVEVFLDTNLLSTNQLRRIRGNLVHDHIHRLLCSICFSDSGQNRINILHREDLARNKDHIGKCCSRDGRGIVVSRRIDKHRVNATITGVIEHITYRLRQSLVDFRVFRFPPI